jgi:hypothetical protein
MCLWLICQIRVKITKKLFNNIFWGIYGEKKYAILIVDVQE